MSLPWSTLGPCGRLCGIRGPFCQRPCTCLSLASSTGIKWESRRALQSKMTRVCSDLVLRQRQRQPQCPHTPTQYAPRGTISFSFGNAKALTNDRVSTPLSATAAITPSTRCSLFRWFAFRVGESRKGDFHNSPPSAVDVGLNAPNIVGVGLVLVVECSCQSEGRGRSRVRGSTFERK